MGIFTRNSVDEPNLHRTLTRAVAALTICISMVLSASSANADWLARNAQVTVVRASMRTDEANGTYWFKIKVSGGNDVCGNSWIEFPRSASPSDKEIRDADAMLRLATAALLSGRQVDVATLVGTDCNTADLIQIEAQ